MKYPILRKLIAVACLLIGSHAFAHDFEVDGIYYKITDETTKTVEVTYRGTSYDEYSNEYSGSIVIPETTSGYSVTSIGFSAFFGCTGLTSVSIPNSVTIIGEQAFSDCSNLTSITIPNSVTTIERNVFYDCTGLVSVTIPNSVTSIGRYAFYNTGWYKKQPDGILYLDNCCLGYKGDKPTEFLPIQEGTRLIGGEAFEDCPGLTSVTIPSSVTAIGAFAFMDCTDLTGVYITDIDAWYDIDFIDEFSNPLYYAKNLYINSELVTELCVENAIEIKPYTFYNSKSLTSVTIGNSVKEIGSYAFCGCSGLTSVTIGNNVTSIGRDAFDGCRGLTSVSIPNSVTTIGRNAFYGCAGLTSVTVPNSVMTIGGYAFYGCTGLVKVNITDIDAWCGIDFYDEFSNPLYFAKKLYLNSELVTELCVEKATEINQYAFYCCTNLTSITIGNSVTIIGDYAFYKCTNLTSITIGNSVTLIGSYAFCGCIGLASIIIPDNVIVINNSAFRNCASLTNVRIGNKCKSIGTYSFLSCNELTEIWFGKSMSTIGAYAFSDCSRLERIYSLNPIPPTCVNEAVFEDVVKNNCALYVPKEAAETYNTTYVWLDFARITAKDFSGVEETIVDEEGKPAEYYNLQGVKVENPENGIFIKKQGSRTTKVVL